MEPPQQVELVATMKQGMATMETLKMLQEEAELIASPRGAKKRWGERSVEVGGVGVGEGGVGDVLRYERQVERGRDRWG